MTDREFLDVLKLLGWTVTEVRNRHTYRQPGTNIRFSDAQKAKTQVLRTIDAVLDKMGYYPLPDNPELLMDGPDALPLIAPPSRCAIGLRRLPVHPRRLEMPVDVVEVPHLHTRLARTVRDQKVRIGRLSHQCCWYMVLCALLMFALKRIISAYW